MAELPGGGGAFYRGHGGAGGRDQEEELETVALGQPRGGRPFVEGSRRIDGTHVVHPGFHSQTPEGALYSRVPAQGPLKVRPRCSDQSRNQRSWV